MIDIGCERSRMRETLISCLNFMIGGDDPAHGSVTPFRGREAEAPASE